MDRPFLQQTFLREGENSFWNVRFKLATLQQKNSDEPVLVLATFFFWCAQPQPISQKVNRALLGALMFSAEVLNAHLILERQTEFPPELPHAFQHHLLEMLNRNFGIARELTFLRFQAPGDEGINDHLKQRGHVPEAPADPDTRH